MPLRDLKFFTIIYAATILLLLVSGLAPYLNPATWWPVALLSLVFPLLVILTILFFLAFLFIKPVRSLWGLAALLLSIGGISKTFPVNFESSNKEIIGLKVMTWNVGLMNYSAPDTETAIKLNQVIFSEIGKSRADVVCLQEFFTAVIPDSVYNFIEMIRSRYNYPYYYFSRDYPKFDEKFFSGTIIFSRHPIIDTTRAGFSPGYSSSVIRTGIIYNGDTIDIFSTRLQNVNFGKDDEQLKKEYSRITRLKNGYRDQYKQAELVYDLLAASKRPKILCADLNDIPSGYVYNRIKDDMEDAWKKNGIGFGGTYQSWIPTLRIDNIFYSSRFRSLSVSRIVTVASDHNAVLSTLQFNSGK